jgi:curli biogenesis system outer membrane secretion channel CsgG
MKILARFALFAAFAAFALSARAGLGDLLKPSTGTKTKDDTAGAQMAEYHGVKHAIGVVEFDAQNGLSYGSDLKENMTAMLESTLFATGRFVIVERGNLAAVTKEQDLQSGGRAAKATDVAQTGKIRSARFLATGTVTEMTASTSGDGGGVNISGFHLGGSSSKASVVVVVKLIDTTTSEVVASERIRGEAGHSSVNIGYSGAGESANLGSFAKTPLGEAVQDCLNQAGKFIAAKMESTAIEGVVIGVTGERIIINLGQNYGIAAGQNFVVRTKGEVLTDPSTGAILGTSEGTVTGTIQVTDPKDKFSYCKLVDGAMPNRADAIVLK